MFSIVIAIALLIVSSSPAHAGPVVAVVTAVAGWFTATFGAVLGTALFNVGVSVLLSTAARILSSAPRVKQSDLIRELTVPTELPPKRFVYGHTRAPGSPAPVRVRGQNIVACYILNSRPSMGPFNVYFDKRLVPPSGDPYNFLGPGASASSGPFNGHVSYWISRGDQDRPPQGIMNRAPGMYQLSDGWKGLTVLWVDIWAGKSDSRAERWPASPPEVMVEGRFSYVWDPRDPTQDPHDPETWKWSANQALCTLDALRMNPLRPYKDDYLWLDTFKWAADVADQKVTNKDNTESNRYECHGVLAYNAGAELEDQVQPLANAGASRFVRSGGRLGLVPAIHREPSMVLTDVLDNEALRYQILRSTNELVTSYQGSYVSPDRQYEVAETPISVIEGAQLLDGGLDQLGKFDTRYVHDHRQSQRVSKIFAMRTRCQRTITASFPPDTFNVVGGTIVEVDFPQPYSIMNGVYEVEEAHPAADPIGEDQVALRTTLFLRETGAHVYAWNAATEERDVTIEAFDPNIPNVSAPTDLEVETGSSVALINGSTITPRIRISFEPSASASVTRYHWEYAIIPPPPVPPEDPEEPMPEPEPTVWINAGEIDAETVDFEGRLFAFLAPVDIGKPYQIRVRAVGERGSGDVIHRSYSAFAYSDQITAAGATVFTATPSTISAIGGVKQIAVTFQAPNASAYKSLEIYAASANNSSLATLIFGPIYGAPNDVVTRTHTGLGDGQTVYYFARALDDLGNRSPFSTVLVGTTTA